MALEKPSFGLPCNGCGLCCIVEPCAIAEEYLGITEGPCPALEWHDDKFRCGMVVRPGHYLGVADFADELLSGLISQALGVGLDCDADDGQEEAAA